MRNTLFALLGSLLLLYPLFASAADDDELIIEINKGVVRPLTLAVAEFKSKRKALSRTINDVMVNDFRLSGHIKTLASGEMPAQPFRPDQIIYSSWSRKEVEYLILGEIRRDRGRFHIANISVADVLTGEVLETREFRFDRTYVRDFGHYVSDYVYKMITGLEGSFSTKLAYVKRRDGRRGKSSYQLVIADADGQRERAILTSNEPISAPTWSPDSTKIAYVSFENGRSNIFVQDITSGKRWLVTAFRGINSSPAWSPDGKSLAVVLSKAANADIYLISLESLTAKQLTNHPQIDTEPSWSPDGKKFLFTSDRSGTPQIYEYELATGKVGRLTTSSRYSSSAHYAYNDKKLVMVHLLDGGYTVVRYDVEDGSISRISGTRLDDAASVSPDGNRVVYSTKIGGHNRLAIASVDFANSLYINTGNADITSVAWSPFIYRFKF